MSSNLLGLNNIINKDKINSSIHLKDRETDMLSNLSFDMSKTEDNNDNNFYDKDIKDIANEIGINLDNLEDTMETSSNYNHNPFNDLNNDVFIKENNFDTMSIKTATIPSFKHLSNNDQHKNYNYNDQNKNYNYNDQNQNYNDQNKNYNFLSSIPQSPCNSIKSNKSNQKHSETQKFNNFNKIITQMNNKNPVINNKSYINNFYEEEVKNKKAMLIEQIQLLKLLLEENGDNVDNIPEVSDHDELKKLEHIHRILKIKKDRAQFSTMGEEILLFFVHLLENVFDGKTTYFGKYTPDIRGFHVSVQHRLRRNRFETSTLVSNFVENYQLSPHSKLLLDLVPSLFLYAYQKGNHKSKFSKKDLTDNLSSVNNI
jgi:hypothetical protein